MNTTSKNICLKCKEETNNAKFCSRSCSSSYNNSLAPKRIAVKRLCKCGEILKPRGIVCKDCNPNIRDWSKVTLREIRDERSYQRNSRLRTLARKSYIKSGRNQDCSICGYSKHFEVAHIVDINNFDLETKVSVVNDMDNLIALCKNHHWEFDNDLL